MKAIRVHQTGGPEVLKVEDVTQPTPAAGQVLVRVRAIGVNPVDTYLRGGMQGYTPRLPYTPGIDAAGVVEAIGPDITKVKPGDRVYTSGTLSGAYAEFALCAGSQVHPLPENVSFSQGAGLYVPYGTAYRGLFQRVQAKAGETVLIHGASGGVGIAAVQFARAFGLIVLATAGTDQGRKLVSEQGAHHVFDHGTPGYRNEIMKSTNGRGVDLILEMLANVNLGNDLTLLAYGGRVVVIGSRGTVEIAPRETMTRESSVLGLTLMRATEQEQVAIHAAIFAGLENGTLRPIVRTELPLAETPRAHELVMQPGALGKIVLVP